LNIFTFVVETWNKNHDCRNLLYVQFIATGVMPWNKSLSVHLWS
jgi:hypothetical protein